MIEFYNIFHQIQLSNFRQDLKRLYDLCEKENLNNECNLINYINKNSLSDIYSFDYSLFVKDYSNEAVEAFASYSKIRVLHAILACNSCKQISFKEFETKFGVFFEFNLDIS